MFNTTVLPPQATSMAPQDWDLLFDAVAEKLKTSTRQGLPTSVQNTVDDCLRSLAYLRTANDVQLEQGRCMQMQLSAAQTALSTALTALRATEMREVNAQQLSMQDGLTELPNRRHFNRRADDMLGAEQRGLLAPAVLFVDLDNFKPVNDLHGHEVGDLLLRGVAQRLRDSVEEADEVCRLRAMNVPA